MTELLTFDGLFTFSNLITLFMLIMLQAVLGFDNLLYITLESKKAPVHQQKRVRQWGIAIAVALRIVLLFVLISLVGAFSKDVFALNWVGVIEGHFNLEAIIVLFGGAFILHTALKEIWHMMLIHEHEEVEKGRKSAAFVVFNIVLMNVVFSFDSILSAMALSKNFIVMATAIIIGGILMIWLADTVANFLERNRLYEVLGLFILFIVGILLLSEGAHKAHLKLFGYDIEAMSKATFYFIIAVLVITEVVQSRYQKKLLAKHGKKHHQQ